MEQTASTHNAAPAASTRRLRRESARGDVPARPQRHYPVQVRASFRRLVRTSTAEAVPASGTLS